MKRLVLLLWLLPTALPAAAEGSVEVTWKDPDDYLDIQPADDSAARFRARLFRQLEQHLDNLARGLPEGDRLQVTFTNVDLAGYVRTGPQGSVRVIGDSRPARLEFDYRLLDGQGKTLREGSERLWGTTTSVPRAGLKKGEAFVVEKGLLTRWFRKTFSDLLER